MKKRQHKIKTGIGWLVVLLCLCACQRTASQNTAPNALTELANPRPSGEIWREYEVTYQEHFILGEDYSGARIAQVMPEGVYFSCGDHRYRHFYRLLFAGDTLTQERLPIPFPDDQEYESAFSVCEDGGYLILSMNKAYEENPQFMLRRYDRDCGLVWENNITQEIPNVTEELLQNMMQDDQGRIYINGRNGVYLFDAQGASLGMVRCPFPYIHLAKSREGVIYAVSGEMDVINQISSRRIAPIDPVRALCEREIVLSGANMLFTGQERGVCYFDVNQDLWEYDFDTQEKRKLLDGKEYDISVLEVADVFFAEDCLRFLFYKGESAGDPIGLYTLRKYPDKKAHKVVEREQITILTKSHLSGLDSIAYAFNRTNQAYRIAIEVIDPVGQYTPIELTEKVNTRMASGDMDLFYGNQRDFCVYKEQGIFENLLPYLENSAIRQEDYEQALLAPFRQGEKLYAISPSFYLSGYALRREQLQGQTIESGEELLAYLKQHPDLKWQWGASPMWVLEMYMKLGWEQYVDTQKGICYFDKAPFQEFMEQIKDLHLDLRFYDGEWEQLIGEKENVMAQLSLYHVADLARTEDTFGDEMVWLGYPAADGGLAFYVEFEDVLCILSGSKRKEGAFLFWEYYLQTCDRQVREIESGGWFPVKKAVFEKLTALAMEEPKQGDAADGKAVLNARQAKELRRIMGRIGTDDAVGIVINQMVMEEMNAYLLGEKTLQEACDILQNRAQLYLYERK